MAFIESPRRCGVGGFKLPIYYGRGGYFRYYLGRLFEYPRLSEMGDRDLLPPRRETPRVGSLLIYVAIQIPY